MKSKSIIKVAFSLCVFFLLANNTMAADQVFFETDFEGATPLPTPIATPFPVWALRKEVADTIGPGNLFEIVNETTAGTSAHSGTQMLRYNYQGRNAFCNNCGGRKTLQKDGIVTPNVFVDSNDADLTLFPFFAKVGRFVYNASNGYSKWEITAIGSDGVGVNNKLTLAIVDSNIDGAADTFTAGDEVFIMRVCGVDGFVADNIDRRDDCNYAINYFGNNTLTQKPGEAMYRRVYVKLHPGSTAVANTTADPNPGSVPFAQKLRYWTDGNSNTIFLVIRRNITNGTITPRIEGLKNIGGPAEDVVIDSINIKDDTWYYIQEEFKPQTAEDSGDGEYRLWFAEEGTETFTPVYEVTDLSFSVVAAPSLWGNHQHKDDPNTFWYMDDIIISNVSIGPTKTDGSKASAPNPPAKTP